jgi:hypothetical protein
VAGDEGGERLAITRRGEAEEAGIGHVGGVAHRPSTSLVLCRPSARARHDRPAGAEMPKWLAAMIARPRGT